MPTTRILANIDASIRLLRSNGDTNRGRHTTRRRMIATPHEESRRGIATRLHATTLWPAFFKFSDVFRSKVPAITGRRNGK